MLKPLVSLLDCEEWGGDGRWECCAAFAFTLFCPRRESIQTSGSPTPKHVHMILSFIHYIAKGIGTSAFSKHRMFDDMYFWIHRGWYGVVPPFTANYPLGLGVCLWELFVTILPVAHLWGQAQRSSIRVRSRLCAGPSRSSTPNLLPHIFKDIWEQEEVIPK